MDEFEMRCTFDTEGMKGITVCLLKGFFDISLFVIVIGQERVRQL